MSDYNTQFQAALRTVLDKPTAKVGKGIDELELRKDVNMMILLIDIYYEGRLAGAAEVHDRASRG